MSFTIGIRREDKNRWERRAPLVPGDVAELIGVHGLSVVVQPSNLRAFPVGDYLQEGAQVDEDLSGCATIFGVKEVPSQLILPQKTYVFFSHVIKGQVHNMPMLRRLMEQGCQLIDYEKIVDHAGRRLVFFGNFAGLAGMIDTLWALGLRLRSEGLETPFAQIKPAHEYENLDQAKEEIARVGGLIREVGFDASLAPLVFGFAGYGNVSRGAQEILDLLPVMEISPSALQAGDPEAATDRVYKVIFKEEDTVEPQEPGATFELQDYYQRPARYQAHFQRFLPRLTVLVNCIYWEPRYPRLVTKAYLRELFAPGTRPRLRIIGDVSCDVEGSIEATVRNTDSGNPVFTYIPDGDKAIDGVEGHGPVILAVDNLPCELPRESSDFFSRAVRPFVPAIAQADYTASWELLDLPPEVKSALILHQGRLTPPFEYLAKHL